MTIKNALVALAAGAVTDSPVAEGQDWKFVFGTPDTEARTIRFRFGAVPDGVAFRFAFGADEFSARTAREDMGAFQVAGTDQFGRYFRGVEDLAMRDGFRFNFRKEAQPQTVPGYEDVAFRFLFGDPLFVAETVPAPLAFRFLFGGDAYDADPDPLPFNTTPLSRYRPFVYEKTVIGRPADDRMGYLVLGETYIGGVE